jgi:SAM-dependent methyltransferase
VGQRAEQGRRPAGRDATAAGDRADQARQRRRPASAPPPLVVALRVPVTALGKVPERIRLAVHQLDPQPGEQILEFGCGPGVAAALVADRLDGGHLVAIDRSGTAIERATARNAERLDRISFVRTELAGFEPDRLFDKAFCVNVNVFWTRSADPELDVLTRCLRPGGQLFVCYESPGGRPSERVLLRVTENLGRHGFTVSVRSRPLLCFIGRTVGG